MRATHRRSRQARDRPQRHPSDRTKRGNLWAVATLLPQKLTKTYNRTRAIRSALKTTQCSKYRRPIYKAKTGQLDPMESQSMIEDSVEAESFHGVDPMESQSMIEDSVEAESFHGVDPMESQSMIEDSKSNHSTGLTHFS
jgi:hypothetical protein